jgi:acetyltransferase-like isoleucine patch superfamily enzyme
VLIDSILSANLSHLDGLAKSACVIGESTGELSTIAGPSAANLSLETRDATGTALAETLADCPDGLILLQAHDRHAGTELSKLVQHGGTLVCADTETGGLAASSQGGRILAICSREQPSLDDVSKGASIDDIVEHLSAQAGQDNTVEAKLTKPVVYPWHIIEVNVDALKALADPQIEGEVHNGVSIEGPVAIGAGTTIKNGTTIEGPVVIGKNCTIGPCAYIRPDTVIGDGCFIGHSFEIFDSVVFDGVKGKHRSYVGHSVVGADANLGCGLITSDYRHDSGSHVTLVDGRKLDSGRTKLGAFIGDDVKTGIQTLVYPGRKIWPGLTTVPGEIVDRDKTH